MNFIRENILKIVIIFVVFIFVIIVVSSCSNKPVTIQEKYETMENNLKEASQKLTKKSNTFLPKEIEETKKVQLSTLIKNEVIGELHANEDANVSCDGYVSITKKSDNEYVYKPYLKCGKYYETKTIAQYILDNEKVVTENDGLYQKGVTYVYRGENPNNYVSLDGKFYRIISITQDKELKLISTEKYSEGIVWDDRYNSDKQRSYGINIFEKSRLKDSLREIYNSEFFSDTTRSFIKPHDICVGKRSYNDTDFSGTAECSVISKNETVGLIQTNEYLYASIDTGCKSGNSPECGNYNYLMNISSNMDTQIACTENSYQFYSIDSGTLYAKNASSRVIVYPVIYLSNDVLYKSGNGTQNNPYVLR